MIGLFQNKASADLRTGQLRLVSITAEMLRAELAEDHALLAELVGARVTAEWPPQEWEPHVFRFILKQYDELPETAGWHRYVVLSEGFGMQRTLVGAVGAFPKLRGDAEIGYSTLPAFQRRGYATTAARALVDWLLRREDVETVSACTYPTMPESIKVMERCGLTYWGEGDEPGTVRYRKGRQ